MDLVVASLVRVFVAPDLAGDDIPVQSYGHGTRNLESVQTRCTEQLRAAVRPYRGHEPNGQIIELHDVAVAASAVDRLRGRRGRSVRLGRQCPFISVEPCLETAQEPRGLA